MRITKQITLILFVSLLTIISSLNTISAIDVTNIQFINHIQANLPEQDVFILNPSNHNEVIRVEKKDINSSTLMQTVYTTATLTPHDAFKLGPHPLGPFTKGHSLNMTLKQWLSASGSGSYSVNGNNAIIKFTAKNLVPNSTYTVWCSRLTFPPNANVVDKPCGNPDGSENVLKTDKNGKGFFNLALSPLEQSTAQTTTVIALAYHDDGKTHGSNPGDFGKNSHVQIFFLIPVPVVDQQKIINCTQNEITKRENIIQKSQDDYQKIIDNATMKRRDALKSAQLIHNVRERLTAIQMAWKDFNNMKHKAQKDLLDMEHQAWINFYQNKKICGGLMPSIVDPLNSNPDERA